MKSISAIVIAAALLATILPAQYSVGPASAPFVPILGLPGATVLATASGCDDCTEVVNLSFPFSWFGGTPQTSVIVTSNGAVIFDGMAATLCCSARPLDNSLAGVNPARASILQEDLDPLGAGSGDIVFLDLGSSAIISFENVSFFPGPTNGSANGQIELYANGAMEIRLGATNSVTNNIACGLSNPNAMGGTDFVSPTIAMPLINALGLTTGGAVPQNTGALFIPSAPNFQINTPEASIDVNGALGSGFVPAREMVAVGAPQTFNINTTLPGTPHDIFIATTPTIPSLFTTPAGQIVNINLGDPNLVYLFGASVANPIASLFAPAANVSIPFSAGMPLFVSAQGVFLNPGSPDLLSLSQASEFEAQACSASSGFEAVATGIGNAPLGWSNPANGAIGWTVQTGGTGSVATGPSAAATGLNYLYAETSIANPATFTIDTCPVDATLLSNFTLSFNLSRIGATVGTLTVEIDDGATGTFVPLPGGSFTGADPAQAQGALEWSPVTIPFVPSNVTLIFRFTYTSTTSFTGDLAIDDILVQ